MCCDVSDSYRVGVRVRAGTVVGFARFEVAHALVQSVETQKKFDTGARRLTLSRECLRVRVDLGAA